ncbi:MAG TPA: efflux RND transporter periplasmic adaptor subunit [Candidatus Binatia bacterium]|jgi:RND family efflux transporter MFP subunit|nr:efflux RND transporter periplasmic adaptor subunit [Candidatus Binatia bacterium]
MSDAPEQLRQDLSALRLSRDDVPVARRSRRGLVIGIAIALVVTALVAMRFAGGRPAVVQVAPVSVMPPAAAGQTTQVPVLSGAGYVVSADRYISIGVRVAGRIDRYVVEEGDHVQEGDALVQLDAREYKAAVERADANLVLARANANLAEQQLRRMESLGRNGIVSRDELDVRRAEAASARARVGQATAELDQTRVALEYTTLRAPRGGVILAKLKEVGEIAVPGGFSGSGDLIRMANLQSLRGQVDVTEAELAKIHIGQRAEVVPDAHPDKRYAAHVVKLYPQVDKQKGTLRVEVQIEQPDDDLWPDMSARITFFEPIEAAASGAVLVPRSAMRTDDAGAFAWVVDDGTVHRTPVTLGSDFADDVQVTSGLRGGEEIVVGDAPPLTDGQRVQPAAKP